MGDHIRLRDEVRVEVDEKNRADPVESLTLSTLFLHRNVLFRNKGDVQLSTYFITENSKGGCNTCPFSPLLCGDSLLYGAFSLSDDFPFYEECSRLKGLITLPPLSLRIFLHFQTRLS